MARKTLDTPRNKAESRSRARFVLFTVLLSLALLGNMIFIFCMSAEDSEKSAERSEGVSNEVVEVVRPNIQEKPPAQQVEIRENTHQVVRKMAHVAEFAGLGFLATALIIHLARRARGLRNWMLWVLPALFGLLYAASDEWHQTFTGRGAAVRDVFIDFAGVLIGLLVCRLGVLLIRLIARGIKRRRAAKGAGAA